MKKNIWITILFCLAAMNLFAQTPGIMKDERDGKVYKTITIGNQTWMAENLSYNLTSGDFDYQNDEATITKYGRLYEWETANNACPFGWYLPSKEDWFDLVNCMGGVDSAGVKLKSKESWLPYNGDYFANNLSGFSAIPGGYYEDGHLTNVNKSANFWTNKKQESMEMNYYNIKVSNNLQQRGSYLSVRCIKDSIDFDNMTYSDTTAKIWNFGQWMVGKKEFINAEWNGSVRNGFAHGKGIAKTPNFTYDGTLINGIASGIGTYNEYRNGILAISALGNFTEGKMDGKFWMTYSTPQTAYNFKNIKYVLMTFENGVGNGMGIFYDESKNPLAKAYLNKGKASNWVYYKDNPNVNVKGDFEEFMKGVEMLYGAATALAQIAYDNGLLSVDEYGNSHYNSSEVTSDSNNQIKECIKEVKDNIKDDGINENWGFNVDDCPCRIKKFGNDMFLLNTKNEWIIDVSNRIDDFPRFDTLEKAITAYCEYYYK